MFKEEINLLFSIIEKELKISRQDVISKSRKVEIADARRIVSVICKRNSKLSLEKIGMHLGGRDHATILSAIKRHDSLYDSDKTYIEKFDNINYKFLSSSVISKKISTSIRELNIKKDSILRQIEKEIVRLKNSSKERKKSLNIGLFMGTFNPIHNGHMMVANTAIYNCNFDEVWFVVASKSPDKVNCKDVLKFKDRVNLIKKSIIDNPFLKVCDIENGLSKPSYTCNTLSELRQKYPKYNFSIIVGSDNVVNIKGWKNFESITQNHEIFYYERLGDSAEQMNAFHKINNFEAKKIEGVSKIDISSTKIRDIIKGGKSLELLRYLIPNECIYLIEKNDFYKMN